MKIKIYARVAHETVAELLATSGDIGAMFHHDLRWTDVTAVPAIAYGWRFDGTRFAPPVEGTPEPAAPVAPDHSVAHSVAPAALEDEQPAL